MHKVYMFLLAFLLLTIVGSLAVMAVFSAVQFVKEVIDDWRER